MTNNFNDMFKAFGDFKAPDFSNFAATNQKNIEAFSAANQAIVAGVQNISRRQAEIARSTTEEAINASKELFSGKTPELNTTKQTELAKNLFESATQNAREISEIAAKSSQEATEILSKRAAESMEEVSKVAA